ncbi:D-methionine transport system permease protein [Butyrivibrio fibrisolvens DSM 3071]|uniref:D-methionine transport system permease protein n=1 Tax=Butyrivibrio fibrisolvens DSM 3071 TaxID=1121131 RepID=A0A1M5U3E2_BUTFI|nr:methionine ABC transporter permease [Butyrivibrio fibrisolvens]SHH57537.1 D-methionine transport system permease protein [Butyrivibrio fibrisolvens DSM 3071]
MSLLNEPFWKVFLASFSKEVWDSILPSVWDTLYMTLIASAITLVFGVILGIVLTVTNPTGLAPVKPLYTGMGGLINVLRSLPQMIMIILMIPVSRLIFGKSYGTNACIIAIAASCIPMYARMVESSLLEIEKGKIDAAKALGSTNYQIITKVIIPETFPSLIRGFTLAVISVISMTALAGSFGAGGIGDIAVRFGYQRFQHDVLFATVYVLVILVQGIQLLGDRVSRHILIKRHLLSAGVRRKRRKHYEKKSDKDTENSYNSTGVNSHAGRVLTN